MKKNFLILLTLICTTLLFYNCNKENNYISNNLSTRSLIPASGQNGITLINGVIYFSDWNSFVNLRNQYDQMNSDEQQFDIEGFTSFKNVWDQINQEEDNYPIPTHLSNIIIDVVKGDGDIYREPQIDFGFYQHVANDKAIFVIQNLVYYFTFSKYFTFPTSQLQSFYTAGISGVSGANEYVLISNDVKQCDSEYNFNGKRYKMSGEWDKDALVEQILTVRTKHRRKTWLGWRYKDTEWLSTDGAVSLFCDGFPNRTVICKDFGKNQGELHKRVNYPPMGTCIETFGTPSFTTHEVKCLDGITRKCELRN